MIARPLRYRRGADSSLDRPAHVRAASGLCVVAGELMVVQDDALFLGIVDVASGLVDDIVLEAGPGGRRVFDVGIGNKRDKLDLEIAFADGDTLVALGSGGLAVRRVALRWSRAAGATLIPMPRLFEALAPLAGGAKLNFEGGTLLGDRLILALRGGDRAGTHMSPDVLVSMSADAFRALLDDPERAPVPAFTAQAHDLGTLEGCALHFSDLAVGPDGALWFSAAAESTDSFYDDGAIVGSVVARLDGPERVVVPGVKIEGIAWHGGEWLAVTDPDDPDRPGELFVLDPITPTAAS